jgi:hypothetical protein
MGTQILSFQVRVLLSCWNLIKKIPGDHKQQQHAHCIAVHQIAHGTLVAHTIIIETLYANRALEVYQMALVIITL